MVVVATAPIVVVNHMLLAVVEREHTGAGAARELGARAARCAVSHVYFVFYSVNSSIRFQTYQTAMYSASTKTLHTRLYCIVLYCIVLYCIVLYCGACMQLTWRCAHA